MPYRPLEPAATPYRHLVVAGKLSSAVILMAGLLAAGLAVAAPAPTTFQAPTRLFSSPTTPSQATLPGDLVQMRYSLGGLDRAARLQTQLENMLRTSAKWTESPFLMTVYVLSRQEWQEMRVNMPFGVPVRVGPSGLAVPSAGDETTARLWSELHMPLPSAVAAYRGAAEHVPSTVMADVLSLVLLGEILADRNRYSGDGFWVRGLISHVALIDYLERTDPALLRDLDIIYSQVINERGRRTLAASDYRSEIDMADWLLFQANFHFGAKAVIKQEGRGVWRKLRKLRKRNDGVVSGAALLSAWDDLEAWYYDSFSAVSTRPAR